MVAAVPLEYIGFVTHVHGTVHKKFERIIAGDRIPDSERKAFCADFEADGINLRVAEGCFSGSLGFLDFLEMRSSRLFTVHIGFIGVEPAYRRKGVGTRLLEEAEKVASERGAVRISACVHVARRERVFPLFEKCGYDLPAFYNGTSRPHAQLISLADSYCLISKNI